MVSSRQRQTELPPRIWLIVTVEALSFLLFAMLHMGVRVPLGFATLSEPVIVPATIVETLAGLPLGASAFAAFRRRPWATPAGITASLASIGGVLLGMAALAAGRGQTTPLNTVYHRLMLIILIGTLTALLLRRRNLGRNAVHGQRLEVAE